MPRTRRTEQTTRTRQRIAATAMELFAQRGFEGVAVAEVATGAGVTEKTVFNHFDTKEDLVYSGDQAFEDALLDAVRHRRPGGTVLEAVRDFLLGTYATFPGDADTTDRALRMAQLVNTSAALRVREQAIVARYATGLRNQIQAELGGADLRPAIAAGAIMAVHQAVIVGYRRGLLSAEPVDALSRRMQAAAAEGFDLLADGLFDFAPQQTS